MSKFTNDWFTFVIPSWEKLLKDLKGKSVKALEIGCFEGRATLWLLENILTNKDSHIIVIDTFEGSKEHESGVHKTDFTFTYDLFINNTKEYKDKITILKGKSEDKLKEIKDKVNLVYIDGSHETRYVLSDAILSFSLLEKDGIMIFDDYELESVAMAIDIFLYLWRGLYIKISNGGQVAIQKL